MVLARSKGFCKPFCTCVDPKTAKGLTELPLFSVGLAAFRNEGRSLEVLLCQPSWLNSLDEWLLPETALASEETISQSADRLAKAMLEGHVSRAVQQQTYVRGTVVVGALSVCYVAVRSDSNVRRARDVQYEWWHVGHIPYSRAFEDLSRSVATAVAALSDDIRAVALLISRPHFTMVELQRALNELRRLAGRQGQMDIRNLRRLLDGADWLQETSQVRSDGAFRPSRLFSVKEGS